MTAPADARSNHPFAAAWLGRPVRDLFIGPRTVLLGGVVALFLAGWACSPRPPVPAIAAVAAVFAEVSDARRRRVRGLATAVRRFRTLARRTVVVHYAPDVEPLDAAVVAVLCERNLPELERAFGRRLRYGWGRRPRVYLFPAGADIPTDGPRVGGYAVAAFGGIVLGLNAADEASVRHEFAHLFDARCGRTGRRPPPIAEEGLAVWAGRARWGASVHDAARRWVRAAGVTPDDALPVTWVYDAGWLVGRHYALAGSFTGYLIGRFGWPAYWRFHRGLTGPDEAGYRRRFERQFGVTFAAVRTDWLTRLRCGGLTGRPGRDSFEPA